MCPCKISFVLFNCFVTSNQNYREVIYVSLVTFLIQSIFIGTQTALPLTSVFLRCRQFEKYLRISVIFELNLTLKIIPSILIYSVKNIFPNTYCNAIYLPIKIEATRIVELFFRPFLNTRASWSSTNFNRVQFLNNLN